MTQTTTHEKAHGCDAVGFQNNTTNNLNRPEGHTAGHQGAKWCSAGAAGPVEVVNKSLAAFAAYYQPRLNGNRVRFQSSVV